MGSNLFSAKNYGFKGLLLWNSDNLFIFVVGMKTLGSAGKERTKMGML